MNYSIGNNHSKDHDNSIVNLGKITNYLIKEGVPNLLQTNYESKYIDDSIKLRLFPTLSYIPIINGKTKFNASMNALRLIINTFILNGTAHLHIRSIKNLKRDPDKLLIKWSTCTSLENKKHEHLPKDKTIFETTKISSFTTSNTSNNTSHEHIVDYILQPSIKKLNVPLISQEYKSVISKKNNENISRVLQGVFIFEFNSDNSKILVHTIEDIELIDYERKVRNPTNLFAC